jgi:hypothetical protein
MKAFKKHIIPFVRLVDNWNQTQQKNPHIDESVKLQGKWKHNKLPWMDGPGNKSEVGKIIKYLMKKGDTKNTAVDKIKQNYAYVSKKYKSAPVAKKAEILTSLQEGDLGLTYKKGKTVKVKHNKSGKEIVIIDKPNVRKEYEKIGFFAEGSCGYGIDGKVGSQPAGPHLIKKKKKKVDENMINEAKYKQTYKSITARDKDSRRIWGSQIGHPRVKVTSWSEVEKSGRMKTAYIEIEGDKDWVDAYKKIAFSGKGNFTDVVKSLKESVNEAIEPSGIMAKINKIVQDKQAAKIGGVLVDMFSAGIMMQIYNAVNDKNKEQMNKGNIRQVQVILNKVMKQNKVRK